MKREAPLTLLTEHRFIHPHLRNLNPPIHFEQARYYRSGRYGVDQIDLIVFHTMEHPEIPKTAPEVAGWFASSNSPVASAHYCLDNYNIVRCVHDYDTAYGAPPCNTRGLHLEHAGYANQTRTQWNDQYSRDVMFSSACLAADRAYAYMVPIVFRTAQDLRRNPKIRGFTTHNEVSQAFHKSDHWDPGPNFPMGKYLQMVKEQLTKVRTEARKIGSKEGDG